jgi:dUTP diphosphatase
MDTLQCVKLDEKAMIPKKAHKYDAGFDLYSFDETTLKSTNRNIFATGIAVAIPKGWYGRIAPRSGLAAKYGIDVLAGVIDSSFRGEIKVILINHGCEDVTIKKGDRIAQLILEKCGEWEIEEVEKLDETERGEGGFGSTGA